MYKNPRRICVGDFFATVLFKFFLGGTFASAKKFPPDPPQNALIIHYPRYKAALRQNKYVIIEYCRIESFLKGGSGGKTFVHKSFPTYGICKN